jgi:hypothetical protein
MTETEAASIHESAHTVIARVLGFACGGARLNDQGGGSATVYAQPHDTRTLLRWATMSVAGGIAEQLFAGSDGATRGDDARQRAAMRAERFGWRH